MFILAASLLALAGAGSPSTPASKPSPPPARTMRTVPSDTIANAIGVDAHFNYRDTPYVTIPAVKKLMLASNFRHIRDAGAGMIRPNMVGLQLTGETAASIAAKIKASPRYEGFELCGNEEDGAGSKDWPAALKACVAQESPLVKPYGKPIIGPSLVNESHASQLGDISKYVQYANVHFGTCGWNPGTTAQTSLAEAAADTRRMVPQYYVTETGYSTRLKQTMDETLYGRACSIPNRYAAAYDLRLALEWLNLGAHRVYYYQSFDVPEDTVFGATGLANSNGTPKPQWVAVNNMIGLFSDRAGKTTTGPAAVSVTLQASPIVHFRAAERRNGSLLVAVWREAEDINWRTQSAEPRASESAIVSAPGYKVSALHKFQPNGTIVTTAPGPVILGPDTVVVELRKT